MRGINQCIFQVGLWEICLSSLRPIVSDSALCQPFVRAVDSYSHVVSQGFADTGSIVR